MSPKVKLSLEQRIAIRRRVIEERKKGRRNGAQIILVMHELAAEHGVSFGLISRTVYG